MRSGFGVRFKKNAEIFGLMSICYAVVLDDLDLQPLAL